MSKRDRLEFTARSLKTLQKGKERDHDEKRMQPHIMCSVGDVAKDVLLPGDPKRVDARARV